MGYTGSVPTATSTVCATAATCWGGTVRSTLSSEWSPRSRQPGIVNGRDLRASSALSTVLVCRVKVSCRAGAKRVEAKGVFVGAEVVRGPHWSFGDQDGIIIYMTVYRNLVLFRTVFNFVRCRPYEN